MNTFFKVFGGLLLADHLFKSYDKTSEQWAREDAMREHRARAIAMRQEYDHQVQKALDRWRMGKAHGRLYETDDDCTLTYCYWHRGEKRRRRQDEALLLECGKLVHKIPRAPDSSA